MVHLRRLHQIHADRVEFLFVYIRDVYYYTPYHLENLGRNADVAKRQQLVREGMQEHHLSFTCMLDREDAQVENLYQAHPTRLLLIDVDGWIAKDSGNSTSAFIPWDEVDYWMKMEGQAASRRMAEEASKGLAP